MLAKITAKNQLTLPKAVTQAVGATEYFEVEARAGQIILTPVRIHRSDAVRAKLAELGLADGDIANAVTWARTGAAAPAYASENPAKYVAAKTTAKTTAKVAAVAAAGAGAKTPKASAREAPRKA
jgi:hypothetical protein